MEQERDGVRYAGVDWSWSEHAVCVVDDTGAAVERVTLPHSSAGLAELVAVIGRHDVAGVAIERRDGQVVDALLGAGLRVFVVHGNQIKGLRSRYGAAGNKDDRFDAYLLADVLRTDWRRFTPIVPDAEATVGLRMLIRARQDLVRARIAALNQLSAHLQAALPGAIGLFSELDGSTSLQFLARFPSQRKADWLSQKRLGAWLTARRYSRRTPARLLAHLRQAPPGLPPGPAGDAAELVTLELVAVLRSLRERLAAMEGHIARALAAHPDAAVFTSLPHAGSVRAASLLAEIGDVRARYPTEATLAAAAGVSPSTRASGKTRGVVFRFGCNHALRRVLIDFADGSRLGSPWAKQVYTRARLRGLRHAHAVRVLARAWVRVIWRCWTERAPYDPARHAGFQRTLPTPAAGTDAGTATGATGSSVANTQAAPEPVPA